MKIFVLALILVSFNVFSKDVKDFNKILIQNVQTDISKNNVQAFEKRAIGRMPASAVEEVDSKDIQETPKFDKMNNRQIGPNKW